MPHPMVANPVNYDTVVRGKVAEARVIAHVFPNNSIQLTCEWLRAPRQGVNAAMSAHVVLLRKGVKARTTPRFVARYSDNGQVHINKPGGGGQLPLTDAAIEGVDAVEFFSINMYD